MRTLAKLLVGVAIVVAMVPAASSAAQLFDFDGQAVNPAAVGGSLSMNAVIVNNSAITLPLPLDLANYQYTVVVTGLVLDSTTASDNFSGGMIAIYEDNATAASYGSGSTFSDGTMILSGTFTSLQRTMFTSTLGSAAGSVDWTGGSKLGDLSLGDRLDWPFLVSISRAPSQVQPGYDERWDGKVEPRGAVVSAEGATWSSFKGRY